MELGWAVLVVGLVFVALIGFLALRAQSRGNDVVAAVSVAEVFGMELRIPAADKAEARQAVHAADTARGRPEPEPEEVLEGQRTTLARILWVDDVPSNNVHENVALEKLGKFVATAVDSPTAYFYLERLEFDLVITDMARHGDPRAGAEMIRTLRDNGYTKPIIVYTADASGWDREAREAGADAVIDRPGELVRTVVTSLSTEERNRRDREVDGAVSTM